MRRLASCAVLAGAVALAASPGGLRRLTHSQYNNTVRDLVGDQTRPALQFPQEDFVHGFKNQAEAQSVSPLLAEAYSAAAEKLARNHFRGREAPAAGEKFVREFGRRVFRRPLTAPEARPYTALFARAGAQAVVEAMLQAPAFLYRTEQGAYGAAGRLSYFLWDTMPDEELFRAAAAGELDQPAGQEKQARRMLGDPKARQALDEFVGQWLRFDRVRGGVKDRRTYPQYSPELGEAMTEETRRLAAHLAWSDGNFLEIFTAEYGFLSTELAGLYGFPHPGEEFGLVKFPAGSGRAGLLGQGTFLTLTSKPDETSPTARGLFVREQLLCQQVPSPPPGTNMNLAPLEESRPLTNQQRLEEHRSNPSCAGCHQIIDPIGFGLEKFDGIGRRREKQSITFVPNRANRGRMASTVELPLEANGTVAGLAGSDFHSPGELGRILASSRECQQCVVKQLFRYAHGRRETAADGSAIQRAFQAFRDSQFRLRELLIRLVVN